jgi:hypothetical protein
MAKHEIYFEIPAKTLLNKDAVFEVYSDDEKMGNLKVSRGTIEWVPVNHSNGYHLTWENFDALMKQEGKK